MIGEPRITSWLPTHAEMPLLTRDMTLAGYGVECIRA